MLDWSQEELAARISIAGDVVRQSEVSRLELGKVMLPRRPRLERIATTLGLPLGELLARSGWTGADAALTDESSPTTQLPVPVPRSLPLPVATTSGDATEPSPMAEVAGFAVRSERLRAALARSRELRTQSEDLCRRASWAITLDDPAPAET